MNNNEMLGFFKQAADMGASPVEVSAFLKEATGADMPPQDVAAMMQAAQQPEQGAPQDPSAGLPPQQGMPPEMAGAEAPPISEEQLEQLAALVAAKLQGSAGPAEAEQLKSAGYIFGHLKAAQDYGYTPQQGVQIYMQALANTEQAIKQAHVQQETFNKVAANIPDKTAAYWQGVLENAASKGITPEQVFNALANR